MVTGPIGLDFKFFEAPSPQAVPGPWTLARQTPIEKSSVDLLSLF